MCRLLHFSTKHNIAVSYHFGTRYLIECTLAFPFNPICTPGLFEHIVSPREFVLVLMECIQHQIKPLCQFYLSNADSLSHNKSLLKISSKKNQSKIREEYSITRQHIQGTCKELLGQLKKFPSTLRSKNILQNCYLNLTGFCVSSSPGLSRGVHRSGPGVKKPCKRIH